MSEELRIHLQYGDLSADVALPTRADGALPYSLGEVIEHVGQMFRQAALDCGVVDGDA